MLLENGKIAEDKFKSLIDSMCQSVVHAHVASLVPFLSDTASGIHEEDTFDNLNGNFEIAVAQAISMKSGRDMFSIIAITKEKFYLDKRFAENISSKCMTKINDVSPNIKHTRAHFFDKTDLEHDYFKRVNSKGSNIYGKSTYKYGFMYAWNDVPGNWISALITNINRINRDDLCVHLGCNYAAMVQEYYDKMYLTGQDMEGLSEDDKFITMFSSLSQDNKEEVYKFMEELAARVSSGES